MVADDQIQGDNQGCSQVSNVKYTLTAQARGSGVSLVWLSAVVPGRSPQPVTRLISDTHLLQVLIQLPLCERRGVVGSSKRYEMTEMTSLT